MDDNFNLGRHEALIERLVAGQDKLVASMNNVEMTLAEQKGERRMVAGVWGLVGGSVVAAAVTLFKGAFGLHS